MKIKTEARTYTFNLKVESENTTIIEDLAVYNTPKSYIVDPDFKENLIELLRDIARFENLSLAEFLIPLLYEDEQEDLLDELNVI